MDVSLYTLTDSIEIAFCCIAYYGINIWLFKQEDKRLLIYWYTYHALIITFYAAELNTLFFLSASCFPVVLMLGILFHQQRLQKMFVVAQRLDPLATTTHKSFWVDELIKFALVRLNEQKELRVIIENHDSLHSQVIATHLIHADLKKNTLELLYDSLPVVKETFLWVNNSGKIVSLQASWKDLSFKNISFHEISQITTAIDCIALHACPLSRRFTIIHDKKILENLSAHHALNILIELHTTLNKKQENPHATATRFTSYNDTTFS